MSTTDDFRDLTLAFPQQVADGIAAAENVSGKAHKAVGFSPHFTRSPRSPRPLAPSLAICGMGGSALPGLLLRDYIQTDANLQHRIPRPIVHRDYGLPTTNYQLPTTIICISYSGNTEETLSAYREARRRRLPLAVIASGGTLTQRAERDNIPLVRISQGLPQRFAAGLQLGALMGLTVNLKLLPKAALRDLRNAATTLNPKTSKAQGRAIARRLHNRIPLIYASERNAALAYIWKIQANENAKVPAFSNAFPELNHNEFNAYALLTPAQRRFHRNLAAVILEDVKDRRRVRRRMRVTASFIRRAGVPVIPVRLRGRTWITKTLNGILLGQWAAGFLAESYGVDPLPVDLIEELKKKLQR